MYKVKEKQLFLKKILCTISDLSVVLFRELFRISISNYQEWFKVAITFWLQTFREECMRRMEKALEIEKDVRFTVFIFNFSYRYKSV